MQRITNSMMTSRFLSNMKRNLNNMSTIQNQLASGKEILRTSQNPFVATRNKQLANQISDNEQYNANIKDTSNWLDTTDTALAQAGNVMARIKELMVKAGNGAYSEDEIRTIKNEVVEKSKELAQIMNTTFDGAYIFGGTKGTTKPVTVDADGNLAYADKDGNAIKIYLNAAGEVTNEPISINSLLIENANRDDLYINEKGQITLNSIDDNSNKENIPVIPSSDFYMADDGKISTDSTQGKNILLKDALYVDIKNNITAEKEEINTLIDTSNTVYFVKEDGTITTNETDEDGNVNIRLQTGTPLYKNTDGTIMAFRDSNNPDIPATDVPQGAIPLDTGVSLYKNKYGDLTVDAISKNSMLDPNTNIYSRADGKITVNSTDKDGNPLSQVNYQTDTIYIDSNGNISKNSNDGKVIVLTDGLYLNEDGQLMAAKFGTSINDSLERVYGGHILYVDENKNITNIENDNSKKIIYSDGIYRDENGELTVDSRDVNVLINSSDALYKDSEGNVTTIYEEGYVKLTTDDEIYKTIDGKVTTDSTKGVLLNSGASLYSDKYGRVTTSSTSPRDMLSESELYVNDANNITEEYMTENDPLTADDVRDLKEELNNPDTSDERKNEIKKILEDEYAIQLLQINEKLKVEISQGVVVEYNKTASDIFEYDDPKLGDVNAMDEIGKLISHLGTLSDKNLSEDNKTVAKDYINGDGLTKMDSIVQNLLANRAQVGTMQNRMESAMETNEDQNYNMTDILSNSEDIDFTEKTMEYAVMQTIYTAALQTSSKVLTNTIMDYI